MWGIRIPHQESQVDAEIEPPHHEVEFGRLCHQEKVMLKVSYHQASVSLCKPKHWAHAGYTREFALFFRFTTKNISSRTTSLLGNDFVIFWAKTKNGHLFVV
jgi:phosphopantothenoylcysteine synthetase/decarboxylase